MPQWGLHQGVFTSALLPAARQPLIAVDDIAEMAAIMFANPQDSGIRTIEIAGDELTPAEMASALTDALGRAIPSLQISAGTLIKINKDSGQGHARINAGEMNVVDITAVRKRHPGLMDFRTWHPRPGAGRLRTLLPQHRPGEILSMLPAWQLSEPPA